jgi:UDP-N-acetylmuramate--alanine ligase
MSAIAGVLVAMGHSVSGSDLKANAATERLASLGVKISVGHDAANIVDPTLVTFSRAVAADNPELIAANSRSVLLADRTEMLAAFSSLCDTLAVSGTHGKTTTTSLLSLVLTETGQDPNFVIGGTVSALGLDSRWSNDARWLVVEADESDGTFTKINRAGAIITNLEPDHLEYFGDWDGYRSAFVDYAVGTRGPVVVCSDDPQIIELIPRFGSNVVTYGTNEKAQYRVLGIERVSRDSQRFSLRDATGQMHSGHLNIGGVHNILNAVAAIALAHHATGVDVASATQAVAKFSGVQRRFTYRAEVDGITLVDDYAHLPTEVRAALSIAVGGGWKRVVAVLQPHRYSRISAMAEEFGPCFDGVDVVVVTDVYGAHETPIEGVTGMLVVDAIRRHYPNTKVVYTPTKPDAVDFLVGELASGDVCVTLGCGDITVLHDSLAPRLVAARA